jgi:hypothetical protein
VDGSGSCTSRGRRREPFLSQPLRHGHLGTGFGQPLFTPRNAHDHRHGGQPKQRVLPETDQLRASVIEPRSPARGDHHPRSPRRREPLFRPSTSPGAVAGANRRDAAHQGDQGLTVMQVGTGDARRDGKSTAVTDDVDLQSELGSIGLIRSGQEPPLTARTLTESTVQRDQPRPSAAPSRSSTTRCSLTHTRARDQFVKRRCAACQETPKTGGGWRQVQPEVATKMIAARTARPSHRRRPPPCTRIGGSGATSKKISHGPSGTSRSTMFMP